MARRGSISASTTTAVIMAVLVVVIAAAASALLKPGTDRAAGSAGHSTGSPVVPGSTTATSATPTAPATPAVPDSIQHQPETPGRYVNITIDDGPDPEWTPKILEVLKEHHVHATFCMIGPEA